MRALHRTCGSSCGEEIDKISWVNWGQKGVEGSGGKIGNMRDQDCQVRVRTGRGVEMKETS